MSTFLPLLNTSYGTLLVMETEIETPCPAHLRLGLPSLSPLVSMTCEVLWLVSSESVSICYDFAQVVSDLLTLPRLSLPHFPCLTIYLSAHLSIRVLEIQNILSDLQQLSFVTGLNGRNLFVCCNKKHVDF